MELILIAIGKALLIVIPVGIAFFTILKLGFDFADAWDAYYHPPRRSRRHPRARRQNRTR